MFQFTTTNVINSNLDSSGKPRWSSTTGSFHLKRVNNFKKENVKAIYKAEPNDPEFAKVTIDFNDITATDGDVLRLSIYIGLTQASQEALYSNDFIYKGKPFNVEFVWKTDAATTVEQLIKTINKYQLLVYGYRLLNVSTNPTGGEGMLTIEAVDEYQRFKKINIEKLDAEAYHGLGEFTPIKTLEDVPEADTNEELDGTVEGFFVGKEGFGTYSFLLHNLRIPTFERTRFAGLNQDESPIVGAKYVQYTLHYCVHRGILGNNAVGDLVTSATTHVFYVREDLAEDFETALSDVAPAEGIVTVEPKN